MCQKLWLSVLWIISNFVLTANILGRLLLSTFCIWGSWVTEIYPKVIQQNLVVELILFSWQLVIYVGSHRGKRHMNYWLELLVILVRTEWLHHSVVWHRASSSSFFKHSIYLFMAVLGLVDAHRLSLVAVSRGYSLIVVLGLLIVVAYSCCKARALGTRLQ